jgi:bacterioferritin-associated ferredoxin
VYVCLCMAITDLDARGAIRSGACTVGQILRACGSARPCGGCSPTLRAILHDARTAEGRTSVLRIERYREAAG